MDEIKELFRIDWLNKWKQMMCRKMFDDDRDEYCIRPIEAFPCAACRYYTMEMEMLK